MSALLRDAPGLSGPPDERDEMGAAFEWFYALGENEKVDRLGDSILGAFRDHYNGMNEL